VDEPEYKVATYNFSKREKVGHPFAKRAAFAQKYLTTMFIPKTKTIILSDAHSPGSFAAGYLACVSVHNCFQCILGEKDTLRFKVDALEKVHFVVLDDLWKDDMFLAETLGAKVTVCPENMSYTTFLKSVFPDFAM
jgi:hypothetical protein